jgi:guanine nucleotide-binding protein G(I)/G(S)/G(T) subunit beta-1
MSVTELKERHIAATETVNNLRERLKQRRLSLLDTDSKFHFIVHSLDLSIYFLTQQTISFLFVVAGYAKSQGRTPVTFGPTDILCCRTLQGHTGKVYSILFSSI